MWYVKNSMRAVFAVLFLALLASAQSAHAAILNVCATCTYTNLDDAFTAAEPGDTIILDGPDSDVSLPPVTYTLTTDLVVTVSKTDLTIRGASKARPDQIIVEGTGAGPVITVEEDQDFEALGFTISGGTTGVLALEGSSVEIKRCLIDNIDGVGVDCVGPDEVYIAGSVITNCDGDATRIDMGGELNIAQSTFITNDGLGVNAISGMANVMATMIHDCSGGMADGSGTALDIAACYVTDDTGAVLATPVVDPYPFTTPLDIATAFETVDPFPGEFDLAYADFPLSGESETTLTGAISVEYYDRDFSNADRAEADVVIGADERTVGAGGVPAWIECHVIQDGREDGWIGEGLVRIELYVEDVNLEDSTVWIANPTQSGIALGGVPVNRLEVVTFVVGDPNLSEIDANIAIVEFTIDLEDFAAAFPNIADVNTTDYEIYIQPSGVPLNDTDILDQPEADGNQAEFGRIFGFDTIPPRVVTNDLLLADQYLAPPPVDGGTFDPGEPAYWDVNNQLLGNFVGANQGFLGGSAGDPQLFFDNIATGTLDFNLQITFVDDESGFAPSATSSPGNDPGQKAGALYAQFADTPGYPWWHQNSESLPELINSPAGLAVTYVSTGDTLTANWDFTGALFDTVNFTQWYAVANIRVMDLAGNEAVLRPFHLWWFPDVQAQFRSGPAGAETANPTFTWGLNRYNGGQDPKDPYPVDPGAIWRVWVENHLGAPGVDWLDITGGAWSQYLPSGVRGIGLDTTFGPGSTLRSLMLGSGAPAGSRYLLAIAGYDEAGNAQPVGALGDLPNVPAGSPPALGGLAYQIWTDPGISASIGLETAVQTTLWHNQVGAGGRDRVINAGDTSFGASSRIGLPAEICARVEAGFNFEMGLPDTNPGGGCNPAVAFELYEDGVLVARGWISPNDAPADQMDFVVPDDLLNPEPSWIILDSTIANRDFLNESDCGPARDRLGDDGSSNVEPPYRQRNVKYQAQFSTGIAPNSGACGDPSLYVYDPSPAVVEFTVTVDRNLNDDQPIKSFVQE